MGLPQSGPFLFRSGGGGGTSSGAAGINYLSAIYAGDTLTNINTYNDGASSTPTDGTGGVVTGLTTALNTSTPLVGTSCVRFSKDASNRQGMGWSYDFTVDDISSDRSTPLYFQMYYRTSANYASSDVRGFLYDVTNGTLLSLNDISNGSGNIIAAPGDSQINWVGFTVTAATSYRLIWHIASTNASAWDLDLDCFVCSPQSVVPGAIVADLGTETWTDNQANATTSVRLTRIGNRLFAKGQTTMTGAMSGACTVTIPTAYLPDSTEYNVGSTSRRYQLGSGAMVDAGTGVFTLLVWYGFSGATTTLSLEVDSVAGTYGFPADVSATVPFTWVSGDALNWEASWIVSGWQASAALSTTETLFTTAKARYTRSSAQTISVASPTILDASTKTYDTLNCVTTGASWKFTAPRSGYYKAVCTVQYVARAYAAGNAALIQLFKNNSFVSQGAVTEAETTTSIVIATNHVDTIYLSKGDYIDFRAYNEGSVSTNTDGFTITVEEIPDFSIFSTYGTFELLTATSSVKTPSATNNYHQLTGNSLTLTPGTWRLYGQAFFNSSGSVTYASTGLGFYGANGADTSSTPALLSAVSGLTVLSATGSDNANFMKTSSNDSGILPAPMITVRCTASCTVYLVTYATMTTAANARITVYANAERLQ